MVYQCPLCNGLTAVNERCPRCGYGMADAGTLQDLDDPYGSYNEEAFDPGAAANDPWLGKCVHLLYCPRCGHNFRAAFTPMEM